jgi:hypothetical protein
MTPTVETKFGRLVSMDSRDFFYVLEAPRLRSYLFPQRMWAAGPVTNQGRFPHCVGHAWSQFLEASPVRKGKRKLPTPEVIYHGAQQVDEWPGPPPAYDGTSVRAGAKVLQSLGLIHEYRWAPDIDTVSKFVRGRGPVVVGTMWYSGMSHPEQRRGESWLRPVGADEGGHAYVIIGFSLKRNAFRIINSWGRGWGDEGRAWIDYSDMNHLIFMQNGEAASAMEVE